MTNAFRAAWDKLGDDDCLGAGISKDYAGAGGGLPEATEAIMHYMADGGAFGVGMAWAVHHGAGVRLLADYGTDEQKKSLLPLCSNGEILFAYAMTEVDDVGKRRKFPISRAEKASSEKNGDNFSISGSKTFVTNGMVATHVIVMAKRPDDSADEEVTGFIVECDESVSGWSRARLNLPMTMVGGEDEMSSGHATFKFDGCKVSSAQILGSAGEGRRVLAPWAMTAERALFYAVAVGGALDCVSKTNAEAQLAGNLEKAKNLVLEHARLCKPGVRGDKRRYAVLKELGETLDEVWPALGKETKDSNQQMNLNRFQGISRIPDSIRSRAE